MKYRIKVHPFCNSVDMMEFAIHLDEEDLPIHKFVVHRANGKTLTTDDLFSKGFQEAKEWCVLYQEVADAINKFPGGQEITL